MPQVLVTAPRAGEYLIEHGCSVYPNVATVENPWVTVKLGAIAPADTEGKYVLTNFANQMETIDVHLRRTLPAGAAIEQFYRSTAGGVVNFAKRWLKVTPIRLTAAATKDLPDATLPPDVEPDPPPSPDPPPAGT